MMRLMIQALCLAVVLAGFSGTANACGRKPAKVHPVVIPAPVCPPVTCQTVVNYKPVTTCELQHVAYYKWVVRYDSCCRPYWVKVCCYKDVWVEVTRCVPYYSTICYSNYCS
jgi:hypothetical protein